MTAENPYPINSVIYSMREKLTALGLIPLLAYLERKKALHALTIVPIATEDMGVAAQGGDIVAMLGVVIAIALPSASSTRSQTAKLDESQNRKAALS